MGYCEDENSVRVDLWMPSGKWKYTISLKWNRYLTADSEGNIELIHETFKRLMAEQNPGRYIGLKATCLEPYHESSYPLMIEIKETSDGV